jgi:hypothetical protein
MTAAETAPRHHLAAVEHNSTEQTYAEAGRTWWRASEHDKWQELTPSPTTPRQQGPTPTPPGPVPTVTPPRLCFQSLADLCAEVDALGPPTWLFRGLWPADAYGVLAAEDKAGKTWAIGDAAVCTAAGRPWLGLFPCDAPGPVLVFVGEGGKRNTVRRLRAIAEAHDVRAEDLDVVVVDRVPHLSNNAHLLEVQAQLEQRPARLVILDPLYLAARGANGSDLYAMGEALEGLQHACQQAGAALLVVTHFRKAPEIRARGTAGRTSSRITGVGPSAWGRVLLTGSVESRYTDPETQRSRVVLSWEIIGGEVPDQTFRTVREVWADDPDDLGSPLHVTWAVAEDDPDDDARRPALDDAKPAARRVFTVLETAGGAPLTVREIGDRLAQDGRALKARTIQDALTSLGPLVDSLVVDARGTTQWSVAGARHADDSGPLEPPEDDPNPWTQEDLT